MREFLQRKKKRLPSYICAWWVPLFFIMLLVAQTHVFNIWLGLPVYYLARLTLAAIGIGFLLYGPAILIASRRIKFSYLFLVTLVIENIFVAQYLYYQFADSFLQASSLRYLGNAFAVKDSALVLFDPSILFFFSGVAALIVAYVFTTNTSHFSRLLSTKEAVVTALIIALVPAGAFGYTLKREKEIHGNVSQIFKKPYDSADLIRKVGIINYGLLDGHKYLSTKRGISPEERRELEQWLQTRKTQQGQNLHGVAKGKNVVFVQLESYHRFLLNREVAGQEITPNLNALAKESFYFPNYYYQTGPGTTSDAEFATLNSLYPLPDRVAYFEHPQNTYNTILHQLKKQEYKTFVMHPNAETFWNRSTIYPQLGYDRFYSKKDFIDDDMVGWGLSDKSFFRQAMDKLSDVESPYFAKLITLTSHSPYIMPEHEKRLIIPKELNLSELQRNYLQTAHYTDAAVGTLIQDLKRRGIYEETVLVVDGDHQGFVHKYEDEQFAKFLGFEKGFSQKTFLDSLQVPLIIKLPASAPKGVVDHPMSHIDIAPTLLNLIGVGAAPSMVGQDIFNTNNPLVVKRTNTGLIENIITRGLFYSGAESGNFLEGKCYEHKTESELPIGDCKEIFDQQTQLVKMSDLLIRGNSIPKN